MTTTPTYAEATVDMPDPISAVYHAFMNNAAADMLTLTQMAILAHAAADAHTKCQEEAGFVVVPREPTERIALAGNEAWNPVDGYIDPGVLQKWAKAAWQAMINAALQTNEADR